jgi:cell division protein FtsZ
MGLFEVNEAAEIIAGAADTDANVIFGAVIDESLGDQMRVTVIATGFDELRRSGTAAIAPAKPAERATLTPAASGTPRTGPTTPSTPSKPESLLPQTIEAFEMDEEVLDIPRFLRDKE